MKKAEKACDNCHAVGASLTCSRCRVPCYCDRNCQKKHWRVHRPDCSAKKQTQTPSRGSPPVDQRDVVFPEDESVLRASAITDEIILSASALTDTLQARLHEQSESGYGFVDATAKSNEGERKNHVVQRSFGHPNLQNDNHMGWWCPDEGLLAFPPGVEQKADDMIARGAECTICLGELLLADEKTTLDCAHTYHKECFRSLVEHGGGGMKGLAGATCPVCRAPFMTKAKQYFLLAETYLRRAFVMDGMREHSTPESAPLYTMAQLSLLESISHDSNNAAVHASLGIALTRSGPHIGNAISELRQAIALETTSVPYQWHSNLAGAHAARWGGATTNCIIIITGALSRSGNIDATIQSFQTALEIQPKYSFGEIMTARMLRKKGDYPGAISACNRAIANECNGADQAAKGLCSFATVELGNSLKAAGDVGGALKAYKHGWTLDPKNKHACTKLGAALQVSGNAAGAALMFRRAIEVDPQSMHAHDCLGGALVASGDCAGALVAMRHAITLQPLRVNSHYNLGVSLRESGDAAGELASYKWAIALDPEGKITPWDSAMVYCNYGCILKDQGDVDGAVAALKQSARLAPNYAAAHWNLATALDTNFNSGKTGNLAAALMSYKRAVELDPKGSTLPDAGRYLNNARQRLLSVHSTSSEARKAAEHTRKRDFQGAAALYKKQVDRDPQNGFAHFMFAKSLGEAGHVARSVEEFESAIVSHSDLK